VRMKKRNPLLILINLIIKKDDEEGKFYIEKTTFKKMKKGEN